MSTVTAADAGAAKGGKKKLLIIVGVVLLLALGGGGAAVVMLKKQQQHDEVADDGESPVKRAPKAVKHDPKAVPAFVPLDTFTVNLADRDTDRFAQVGITLELADASAGDQIKAFMPAIRDRILMAIADRTAGELLGREGKQMLADRVRRETSTVLGYDVPDPPAKGEVEDAKSERRRLAAEADMPIQAVHFSNFIVQ